MVKLLHLADAQLGGRLHVATDALLTRVRAAQRAAFRRAVGCALREDVDAVLIAGNLFDDRGFDYDTEQFLVQQLARLDEAGVPCFYAAGAADPGGARSRGGQVDWPPSLHRFAGDAPERAVLEDEAGQPLAHVVGAGHTDAGPPTGGAFPKPSNNELPHVGLLHAPRPAGTENASPVPEAVRDAGYAYWALGGAPRHQQAPGVENTAWYAGPTAGRRPVEGGLLGGLLVTLEAGQAPQVAFRPVAPLCWADVLLDDLDGADTRHELLQRAQRAFEQVKDGSDHTAWLVRFTLAGGCPLAPSLYEEDARGRLEEALAEHLDLEAAFVRLRHLTPPVDPDRHRGEPHVLSEALAVLDRAAADPALLQELAPGVLAALPSDADPQAYLRERLPALDREACVRLLRERPAA